MLDATFNVLFADLLINLAAAWIGAAIVVPAGSGNPQRALQYAVPFNLAMALLFFLLAYKLIV